SLKKVEEARAAARDAVAGPGASIPAPRPAADGPAPKIRTVTGKVKEGESLGGVLRREKLRPEDADAVLRALGATMDFKKEVRAKQKYVIRVDDGGRLVSFDLHVGPGTVVNVARDEAGNLVAPGGHPPQH